MDSDAWFDERFAATRALVIARGLSPEATVALATRAWDAGVTMLEVPLQGEQGAGALRAAAAAARARGLVVGAGTVVDPGQVALARDAGAAYLVSPGLDEDVVAAGLGAGLAVLPGVSTPTEVQRAGRLGLHWLKAFPASVLGPGWFRALRAPFPEVRLVATGGITTAVADEYLVAGARVVSFGSGLDDPAQLARWATA